MQPACNERPYHENFEFHRQRFSEIADVLAIPVTPGDKFAFGTPRILFAVNFKSGQGAGFLVTDKGQRILTNELPQADPSQSGARLIQNWSTALAVR